MKLLVCISLLALFACSNQKRMAKTANSNIYGKDWTLSMLNGRTIGLENGKSIFIRIDSSQVLGNAGCNRLRGKVDIASDRIHFEEMITTKMACPSIDTEVEFLHALSIADRYIVNDEKLELYQGETSLARFK